MGTHVSTRQGARSHRKATVPRVVIVTRPTELDWMLRRHGTLQQAAFFLSGRDQGIEPLEERHTLQGAALHEAQTAIPADWRRAAIGRDDLSRFLFEPDDIVVVVGQDGLVANAAKYLDGQLVIGLNPDPARYEGVLVPHAPAAISALLRAATADAPEVEARTMVRADLDDGRRLIALNEVFIGHRSHQSARYEIAHGGHREGHSSSGVIVSTGTGATGWARSIARSCKTGLRLPRPTDRRLAFFVREAWPSVATCTDLVEGLVQQDAPLSIVSRMEMGGVVFGDGIESDRLELRWGQRVDLRVAQRRLRLLRG